MFRRRFSSMFCPFNYESMDVKLVVVLKKKYKSNSIIYIFAVIIIMQERTDFLMKIPLMVRGNYKYPLRYLRYGSVLEFLVEIPSA